MIDVLSQFVLVKSDQPENLSADMPAPETANFRDFDFPMNNISYVQVFLFARMIIQQAEVAVRTFCYSRWVQ